MTEQPSRLEQLGQLFTAMIAVMLSGSSELTSDDHQNSEITNKALEVAEKPISRLYLPEKILRKFERTGEHYGLLSKIARDLDVSQSAVSRALHGQLQSKRIIASILTELTKYEDLDVAACSLPQTPLSQRFFTDEQIAQFQLGGRYYGIQSGLARQLGVNKQTISDVLNEKTSSARIRQGIKAEMARIDAERAQ